MKNDTRTFFSRLLLTGLLAIFAFLLCTGCRSEQLKTGPLEPTTPHLVTSAPQKPAVNFKRPAYAQSIPSGYDYSAQPQPKLGLVARVKAKLTGKTVDKSRTTVNIYNAPTGVKNSTVATSNAQASDYKKADLRGQNGGFKTKEKPKVVRKIITKTITKTTPWYVLALIAVLSLAAGMYIGVKFFSQLRWLAGVAAFVLFCLASPAVLAQRQLVITHSRNYNFKVAKQVERSDRKARKKNLKQHKKEGAQRRKELRQNLRDGAAEHRKRLQLVRELRAASSK
ncbi:hypothetical protein [Hymenobacter crusticola]|uniref:Uncharacterized protein n=1 Tax=Hymenobacter crusticola TaxID=1770526 RepID=A0A243W5P4_9BACT|nr:hypothetical protein [Hymenobacter crusticola]OUJ68816.1 hypothetical protein BXP70_27350 [Hymenobacter crusticola]